MGRVALVTGGSGFIGGHLCDRLLGDGWTVRVIDPVPPRLGTDVDWVEGDVRDRDLALSAARGVEMIFHLGAIVGVDRALADPVAAIDVTVAGTLSSLEAAHEVGAGLVHLSSSEVLGRNPQMPWSEDSDRHLGSALTDRWSYASAKAAAEHLVIAGAASRSIAATVIRPFNVYGPHQEPRFVVPLMVGSALSGAPIHIHGDGTQTRCFTYVGDVVAGIAAVADKVGVVPLVHIGSDSEISIKSLAELILDRTGSSSGTVFDEPTDTWGARFEDIDRRLPDTSLAMAMFGWTATVDLMDGLDMTIEWFRKRNADAEADTCH